MTVATSVWRFTCDNPDDTDPIVQVFIKRTATVDDVDFTDKSIDPIQMSIAELSGGLVSVQDIVTNVNNKITSLQG